MEPFCSPPNSQSDEKCSENIGVDEEEEGHSVESSAKRDSLCPHCSASQVALDLWNPECGKPSQWPSVDSSLECCSKRVEDFGPCFSQNRAVYQANNAMST